MMKSTVVCMGIAAMLCGVGSAQSTKVGMPDSLVVGRFSFIDIGPPFDFYEVIRVESKGDDLSVERALVIPLGQACGPLATVEITSGKLHETLSDLLGGKNPCTIPEKALHRELKRCKHCLTFSGVNVTMQVSCGNEIRQLRMDILDRDSFDAAPRTPENTSWTMGVLIRLDKALGPGVWDKPMFATGDGSAKPTPGSELAQAIRDGKFDALFGKEQLVSQIARDAEKAPPPPPSVDIESVLPIGPNSPTMPVYPAIAKAARVEGLVNVTFDIGLDGKAQNVVVVDGPRMLQQSVIDGLSNWSFPESAWGSSGRAAIRFRRNCPAGSW